MGVRITVIGLTAVLLCLLLALWMPQGARTQAEEADSADLIAPADTAACLECHGDGVDYDKMQKSAHGKLRCQDCHAGINQYPHPEKAMAKKPACATCHARETTALKQSVHAAPRKKGSAALQCATCHGSVGHEVAKITAQPAEKRQASCAACHQEKVAELAGSVHGTKGQRGRQHLTCKSCHADAPHGVKTTAKVTSPRGEAVCAQCHGEIAKAVEGGAHGKYARQNGAKSGCFTCHGTNPHTIADPARTHGKQQDAQCRQCHGDVATLLETSAHGAKGHHAGKSLSCLECHGGSPHRIDPSKHLTTLQKSAKCESCHAESTQKLVNSAHGPHRVAMAQGRHINCLTCHGGSQHAVTPPAQVRPLQQINSCKECHQNEAAILDASVHGRAAADAKKPLPNCITCHAANPKDVTDITKMSREELETSCRKCHGELTKSFEQDVHARPDKEPGDHPTCLTCHGGMAHGITKKKGLTPQEKVAICADCHQDAARMARYGLTTDTVPAYEATVHGKTVLRMQQDSATCVDCHGLHGIVTSSHPDSPTHPRNTPAICAKCHEGKSMNFAFPYASHARFAIERSIVAPLEKLLVYGMLAGSLLGVLGVVILGGRQAYHLHRGFGTDQRAHAAMNALCLLSALLGLTVLLSAYSMALLRTAGWQWPAYAGAGALGVACLALIVKWLFFRRCKDAVTGE